MIIERDTRPTRRSVLAGCAGLIAAAALASPATADATSDAQALVQNLAAEMTRLVNSGRSESQLYGEFERVLARYADLPAVAASVLGPPWRSATDAQKRTFVAAFQSYLSRKYGRQFNEYRNAQIRVAGARDAGKAGVLVSTAVVRPGQENIGVDWQISARSGSPKVVNLIIEGVSMLANERAEVGRDARCRGRQDRRADPADEGARLTGASRAGGAWPVTQPEERSGIFAGSDPFEIARAWLHEAEASEPNDPNAVALATVDASGLPDARMVLLKEIEPGGFVFFTNYTSRKAAQIEQSGKAAFVLHWKTLRRQIRVRGAVAREEGPKADAYYRSRSLESRLGAWASQQSQPLASRSQLTGEVARYADLKGPDPERPPFWGGFRVTPVEIEFWADGAHRLHDRFRWTRADPVHAWNVVRLYP